MQFLVYGSHITSLGDQHCKMLMFTSILISITNLHATYMYVIWYKILLIRHEMCNWDAELLFPILQTMI